MKYKKIGNSSLNASVIGLGSLHFGVFMNQKESSNIINHALNRGINFIDTSPIYGNGKSESFIKNAIKDRRDEVILSTKVGLKPITREDGTFGVDVERLTKNNIESSLDKSLRALGTDYIDLYQLHAFDPETPIEETMEIVDKLIEDGKIRFIGCSNYNLEELNTVCKVVEENRWKNFSSFQVHYNLMERRAEEELVPRCRELGNTIIVNRALAKGILTGKYKLNKPLPKNSRGVISMRIRGWLDEKTLLLIQELENFAKECGHTATELAISWLLSRNPNALVLAGVRNSGHLNTWINAVGWVLSNKDMKEIDGIIEDLNLMSQVESRPDTFFEK